MQAADIMTTDVVTVEPETEIRTIVDLLLKNRISAVPVVDGDRKVLGIVSEGDLMRRIEGGTGRHQSWWLGLMTGDADRAKDFVKTHGQRASEVMTRDVVSVDEHAELGEIARILEEKHIKRVPVVRDGRLVGIVSRSNLLQALAAKGIARPVVARDDRGIRETLLKILPKQAGVDTSLINIIVVDGVVELWGLSDSEEQRTAAGLAASEIEGVKSVQNNLGLAPKWVWTE